MSSAVIEEVPGETFKIKYTRPWLTQYQLDAIFHDSRYGEIEASTKSGKTVGCLAWIFEKAALTGKPGRNYWWVAPVYSQADTAYQRLKLALAAGFREPNDSHLRLKLPNQAIITFKSAEKPDNLYSEDVYAAVIDEAPRMREEAWWALRSTLTKTEGPVRIIGNVKGRRNWFYQLCQKAKAGEPGHKYSRITSMDAVAAGIISQAEIDDARRTLPANIFKELYEAEPGDDAGNPFGIDAIRARIAPMSNNAPVAFGVDLAKSHDWTVVIGLDENGYVASYERFQSPWQETISRVRRIVGERKAFVDSTGLGDPVLESLQREGGEVRKNFEGFKFTSESKQRLMEGLSVAIQGGNIAYPDGVIVSELESFEYEYVKNGVRYEARPGSHDDTVCALALALMAKNGDSRAPKWRPVI